VDRRVVSRRQGGQRSSVARRSLSSRIGRQHRRRRAAGARHVPERRPLDLPGVRADGRRTRAVGRTHLEASEELIMIRCPLPLSALLFPAIAPTATAQQPPRPNELPRAVTLPLAEYNRLIDLASRPPTGAPLPPVAAVLSGADLRVRVERDTVRGAFALTGEVLRAGVSRIDLIAGATL